MNFKYTACLAALLMASPITCQTALGGVVWDENAVSAGSGSEYSGKYWGSSGYTEVFPQPSSDIREYESIYIGHADTEGEEGIFVDDNTGIIGNGVTVTDSVIGGYFVVTTDYKGRLAVRRNHIILKGGSQTNAVLGGYGYFPYESYGGGAGGKPRVYDIEGEISYNTVTAEPGSVAGTIYGGKGGNLILDKRWVEKTQKWVYTYDERPWTVSVLNNTVTVTGGKFQSAYGGHARASNAYASNNSVIVLEGTCEEYPADKSSVDDEVENTGSVITGGFAGGNYDTDGGTLSASDNTVEVTKSSVNDVFGGQVLGRKGTASATSNTVTLTDSDVQGNLYGGSAGMYKDLNNMAKSEVDGKANANNLYLNGGTYKGDIYGGYASVTSGTAEANDNLVALGTGSDGTSSPDLTESTLYGGSASAGGTETATSGNTLKFRDVSGMQAVNIKNFQKLNFEYENLAAGDIVLTLSGAKATATDTTATNDDATATTATDDASTTAAGEGTSVAGAEISVSISSLTGSGGGDFLPDDKVILLRNENGLDTTGIKTSLSVASQGISLAYDVQLFTNTTDLYLTCSGSRILPETKVISEGAASGLALAGESANATMGLLRDLTLAKGTITPFAHVQGSSMRYETGSSINVSAVSLVAGLGSGGIETGIGTVGVGAFFEYGKGSYTTHNSFDSRADVDGNGTSWYMGGGILAQMDFVKTGPGHFYVEGSAHMGNLHNEFDSDLADSKGNIAKLDMDTPYYSLHGGLGYVWDITEGHELDVYGKYIWTRVQGTDETLSTKDKYEFDDMDSNRVRLGARYTYTGSERFSPYVGLAFEHEFSGSCDAKVYDRSVAAPSFEGSSGMGELGIIMKPAESLPLSINLGVQGFVGQKQGVSGSCNVMYEF